MRYELKRVERIPFTLDVVSAEYRSLWPHGYEPWCAELEVFHNPFAVHPLPHELLPETMHWYMQNGEIMSSTIYAKSILFSRTDVLHESVSSRWVASGTPIEATNGND